MNLFSRSFPRISSISRSITFGSHGSSNSNLDVQSNDRDMSKYLYYFVGIDNARFKKQVVPGDIIIISAKLIQSKSEVHKF